MTWDSIRHERYENRCAAEGVQRPPLGVGVCVLHKATERIRSVTGVRGDVVHLSQCIKLESGETFYWCSVEDLVVIG